MAEDHVERRVEGGPGAETRTTTTVVERRSSVTPLLLIALLIAVGAVAYFMFAANERAETRDNAIANAAGEIGDAADSVGDAVRREPAR